MADYSAMELFIQNLTIALDAKGITWRQLAELSGVNESNLSKIRHGKEGLSLGRAESIAAAAGLSLHQLLDPEYSMKSRKKTRKTSSAA